MIVLLVVVSEWLRVRKVISSIGLERVGNLYNNRGLNG